MKKLVLISGLCLTSLSQAEPRSLPPMIDYSNYVPKSTYAGQGSSNQATLGMLNQVNSLQTEIQQLRGLVEQQMNELSNLKKRQQGIYTEMLRRFQKIASANANSIASRDVLITEDSTDPIAKSGGVEPVVFVNQATAKKVKSTLSEKMAFNVAYANVRDNHYKLAIVQLKQFLIDYPVGEYSDNVQFWLASVYRVTKDIPAAKDGFKAVVANYPKSDKASISLFNLANIYMDENNKVAAKKLYEQLTKQYADSSFAKIAQKKLREMDI
jgi:tol-pal system protein YbgF